MAKLNFQQPLLQSSVSHDSTEIILICWFRAEETFLLIINVEKTYVLLNISLMSRKFQKNSIINVFFVTLKMFYCYFLLNHYWIKLLISTGMQIHFSFMEMTKKCAKKTLWKTKTCDDNYMKLPLYPVDGSRGSLISSDAISTPQVSGLDFEFIIKWL